MCDCMGEARRSEVSIGKANDWLSCSPQAVWKYRLLHMAFPHSVSSAIYRIQVRIYG